MDEGLTLLGLSVPDSALSRRARELITDVAAPFLVNHSVRVYAWAVELARNDRARRPTCPAADMIATGILEEITHSPFDS